MGESSSFFIGILLCIFAFLIFNNKADVCNQLTTNLEVVIFNGSSIYNWTAQFSINQTSDGHRIYITKGANSSMDPDNIYANETIGADYDWGLWGPCTVDPENGGCYWFTKAGLFSPYLTFTKGYETWIDLHVAHTYVDEGYFGETHGMVFTNANSCYDYNVDEYEFHAIYEVTCDNYVPVPPVVTPSKTCTTFSLDAVVYDTSQNFKIITSVSTVVNVSNNIGLITGIANGPDDLISGIYMNAEVQALALDDPMNIRHNSNFSVNSDTNRYVFSWWQMNRELFKTPIEFNTGKLIVRNGISYFAEGTLVTENNDCLFNSATLSTPYVGTSSFCCNVFQDVVKPGAKNVFQSSQTSGRRVKTPKYQKIHSNGKFNNL